MFITQSISKSSISQQATQKAIQPKLKVNKVNDSHEQEADAMAESVVKTIPLNGDTQSNNRNNLSSSVQRQSVNNSEGQSEKESKIGAESEDIQQKVFSSDPPVISRFTKSVSFERSIQRIADYDFLGEFTSSLGFGNSDVQMKGEEGGFDVTSSFEEQLNQEKGKGAPLSEKTRSAMEPHFGSDLGGVRVHTGTKAEGMNETIGSRAFTHGNDIFFNRNQYNTESKEGNKLIAHEVTHTVQQGATVQRKERSPISKTNGPKIQGLLDVIKSGLARFARYIPGFTLMTVIVGFNPLTGESVAKTPENLLGGILGLIPVWGTILYDKLVELGIVSSAMTWVREQLHDLDLSVNRLERTLEEAWDRVSLVRGWDYNVNVLDQTFGQLFRDIRTFAGRVGDKIIELIKEALLSTLKAVAESFPGYPLLTKILGKDPLTGEIITATTAEIIEEFLILIGKEQELEKRREEGTIQRTADWIDEQLAMLNFSFEEIKSLFETAWNAFSFSDVRDPVGAFNRTVNIFRPFTTRLFTFARNVAIKVLEFIKDVLLRQLSTYARTVRGYHLLTVILGKDPFTDEVVERNVENIIRGFMSLMEGGEEKFQEMKQTGAIQRASDQIQAAVDELGFNLVYIVGLFIGLWNSFSIEDIFHPLDAFQRIIDTLGQPIAKLFIFLVKIIKIVVVVILEVMNFPFDLIGQIIANTQSAFNDIKKDPIQFFINLLNAVKKGFEQFFDNILTHLLNGLKDWLFGQLGDAGITPPQDLSLQSILGLVLEILGISADRIWEKLGQKIGADKVARIRGMIDRLTGIWAFVKDVMERGPVAIWEYIQEKISDLWNVVLDSIKNWIMTKIIEQVTVKLLSMLDPTGIMAVVNSFIAFYKAVQSFIEQLRAMLEIVNSFVAGIANIARGSLNAAANFLENALARGIPVAIGFLANQVGLGRLGQKIGEMIEVVREKVDIALDWLIDKAVSAGSALLNMGRQAVVAVTGAIRNWWTNRKPVTTNDGHNHEIFFQGTGTSARLMINSDPQPYAIYINTIKAEHNLTDAQVAPAIAKANQIDQEKQRNVPESEQENHGHIINSLIDELVTVTATIPLPSSGGTNTPPMYGPIRQGFGTFARVAHIESPHNMGSEPSVGNTPEYNDINMRRQGSGAYYVKGHLLNDNLGGPGTTWSNLTPLTVQANADHKTDFENEVKRAVNGTEARLSSSPDSKFGSVQNFSVIANYGRSLPPAYNLLVNTETDELPTGLNPEDDPLDVAAVLRAEQYVPIQLVCHAELTFLGQSQVSTIDKTIQNDIQYGNLGQYSLTPTPKRDFYLSQKSLQELQTLNMIGPVRAQKIVDIFSGGGRITNYATQIGITKKAIESANPRYRIKQ